MFRKIREGIYTYSRGTKYFATIFTSNVITEWNSLGTLNIELCYINCKYKYCTNTKKRETYTSKAIEYIYNYMILKVPMLAK